MQSLESDRTSVERSLDAILRPSRVAVIGASAQRQALGNQVLDNLRERDFEGEVVPIHPRAGTVSGHRTVPSVQDVDGALDVAVVCVPAAAARAVLDDLDRSGCAAAVLPTAGFSDEQLAELEAASSGYRMAVHGPNCLGTLSLASRAPLWTARMRRGLARGPVAVVAQSGSAALSIMSATELTFSRVISTGNELRLSSADYLHWLSRDDATEVVAAVVESIDDPERFREAALALRRAGKPLVVLKVGRTSEGARATVAHTGALVNPFGTYEAFMRRIGVPMVADYDELIATVQSMTNLTTRPSGHAIGVIAISGGQSALACDLITEAGATVAQFSAGTRERLRAALPGVSGENPVDINASVDPGRDPDEAIGAVLADGAVDSVIVVQDAQETLPLSPSHPYAAQVASVVGQADGATVPLVIASSSSGAVHPLLEGMVADARVPIVRGLREAVVAVRNLAEPELPAPDARRGPPAEVVAELEALVRDAGGVLPRSLSERVLGAYELPVATAEVVRDGDGAAQAAERLGYPAVVKVVSADVPHRADVGGVVLGVRSGEEARQAVAAIEAGVRQAHPTATIDGFEVQHQVVDAIEVLVGSASAPPFGATVITGSGGALAELAGDAQHELAPVSRDLAGRMVARTRAGTVLAGYRNLVEPTDLGELVDVISRLSWLAHDLGTVLSGIDLNPVLVEPGSGRVTLVDALLTAAVEPPRHGAPTTV